MDAKHSIFSVTARWLTDNTTLTTLQLIFIRKNLKDITNRSNSIGIALISDTLDIDCSVSLNKKQDNFFSVLHLLD